MTEIITSKKQELSPQGQSALVKLMALRKLTFETNAATRRSQNEVLRSVTDNADMIRIAEMLADHQIKFGW